MGAGPDDSTYIHWNELGKLLKERLSGTGKKHLSKTRETVAKNVFNLKQHFSSELLAKRLRSTNDILKLLKRVENGEKIKELTAMDIRLLTHAYGLSPLMVESLFAEEVDSFLSIQSLAKDFKASDVPPVHEIQQYYGEDITYCNALKRIPSSDVVLVYLKFGKNGISSAHNHPGDELALCLAGEVDYYVGGLTAPNVRLKQWDFIHFQAENTHHAEAVGDRPAELLIVRFLQQATGRSWNDHRNPRQPDQVADYSGLASLLRRLTSRSYLGGKSHLTQSRLSAMASKNGLTRFNEDIIARLHKGNGAAPVTRSELCALATVYRVSPVLFYEFLKSPEPHSIVVRLNSDEDMETLDNDFAAPWNNGLIYKVPKRRLEATDVGIATVTLEKGAEVKSNSHPGHEILIPMKASDVRVRIGDCQNFEPLQGGVEFTRNLAHFASRRPHIVKNFGSDTAQLLVLRSYRSEDQSPL